ncbi:UDP-N-acetylmuramate dehydrogenase [Saccharophagus degradans]|uniref:UDP-N-acetylmuramate dehydrogenase n=1 Tax=Saccharophagus degradans TaxID=86304 RepID=UPI001C09BD7C|nr:UDP-N-acetylmuramate dehydrogenase [Saccharophagus degradans]MBU2985720.1 UDP-N-acetylmuramate dehydrogenase [Saccharophagus degradans]
MHIQEQVNIQSFVTLAVPAIAKFYCEIHSQQDLLEALRWAQAKGERVVVLGGGSNVLPDEFINALVLHIKLLGKEVLQNTDTQAEVQFGAGEEWHELVMWALGSGFYGVENLALIPGTVGAAPIQNIGAYGVELERCFKSLTAINRDTLQEKIFTKAECDFGYRDSVFKKIAKDKYIITQVTLVFNKTISAALDYPALLSTVEQLWQRSRGPFKPELITPLDVANAVVYLRQSKLPDPQQLPNVGSFFKNPVVANAKVEELKQQWPDIVVFNVDENTQKIPAGWLIDKLGWKGKEVNGVVVHKQQALVLTNPNKLSTACVLATASAIQASVLQHSGIALEIEPQCIG